MVKRGYCGFVEVGMNTTNSDAPNEDVRDAKGHQSVEAGGVSRIKDLVQRFRVCWEVLPEQTFVNREMRNIGFSLELYGTHEAGTGRVEPGCVHCIKVQSALNEIAKWILPREERVSRYEVRIDRQSLSYSHERADRSDVRVTIRILHRGTWDQPVDPCELRCLSDMEHALSELGACKGAWKSSCVSPRVS